MAQLVQNWRYQMHNKQFHRTLKSAPVNWALACYFIKVCLLPRCRKERRNMEEFQTIAKSQQMGVVVLRRIVRNLRVHGLMVSNAKGNALFRNSSRGRSFRPKNWSFVARKWQKNEDFSSPLLRKPDVFLTGFGERLTMQSSRSLSLTRTLCSVAAQRRLLRR